jgi:uncharacterized damage-inducible protein DinB
MKAHVVEMARYNSWANSRLYRMASALTDEQYRRHVGAYFKSLHGTLNHLLTADLIWLHRLTGTGVNPGRLDAVIGEDLPSLTSERQRTDERLLDFVQGLSSAQIEETWEYRTLGGAAQSKSIRDILAHLFNHQTHHRGQAHMILTVLGVVEPEPLDLLIMQRERQEAASR